MSYNLQIVQKGAETSATALHDGKPKETSSTLHPFHVVEFVIETGSQVVYFGEEGVSGSTNGMTLKTNDQYDFESPPSRGTLAGWDLRKIYYVGGAFKLIIIREVP